MPARRTIPLFALRPLLASLFLLSLAPGVTSAQPTLRDTVYFFRICPHDGWVNVSRYKCSDSTLTTFRAADIKSVTFTMTLKDNRTFTQHIPPGTDALFLSNIAIEKFLRPYYVGVNDAEKAADLRAFVNRVVAADSEDSRARRQRAPRRRP